MTKNINTLDISNDFDHELPTQPDNNMQNNHFFRYYRSLSVNDNNQPSHYYQLSPDKTVIGSSQSCKSLHHHDSRQDLFEMDDIDVVKERIDHSLSDEEISDMEETRKKNCFQRICRPIASGSLRSSIVTLISGCAGVGMLG